MPKKLLDINGDGKVDGKDFAELFKQVLIVASADGKVTKEDIPIALEMVLKEVFQD